MTVQEKVLNKSWFVISIAAVWILSYFVSRGVLESVDLSRTARILVAFIPVIPFGTFLGLVIRNIGQLDEMERKIHLEAMAFAFPMAVLLLMILGLMQLAIPLSPDDWSYRHVWSFLPIFYFTGLAFAWRKYK